MKITNRREFLGGIGSAVGFAAVGFTFADRRGFAEALAKISRERLRFGELDPLVDLLQATPPDALMPLVVKKLRSGTSLSDVVAAAALANARAYGGTNYNGYHTLMAMIPSYEMAPQMPTEYAALPVLKVLHRNARFFQDSGRANDDALEPLEAAAGDTKLVESIRARDLPQAERSLALLMQDDRGVLGDQHRDSQSRQRAYEEIQSAVRDDLNVHRVVLSWRAYDLLRLTGQEHALTMLRQSVRFCIDEDGQRARRGNAPDEIHALLLKLMDEHGLDRRDAGTRTLDTAALERLSDTFFSGDRATAARAAASALADGVAPEDVGAAMSLAATRLLLNDPGYTQAQPGKPIGSVHGASVGVHASDAANAWRHIARTGSTRNAFASLITGAYHTAGQSSHVGALANDHDAEPCTKSEPAALLKEIEGRIRDRDQKGACQAARRYCALGHSAADLFTLLLGFAVSEDGALHAEKYFRTAQDEHSTARPEHRALYLVALTRVMASHFGFPAPGYDDARKLLST